LRLGVAQGSARRGARGLCQLPQRAGGGAQRREHRGAGRSPAAPLLSEPRGLAGGVAMTAAPAISVAVLGGGRWARALYGLLLSQKEHAPERVARVLNYRDGSELAELSSVDLLILAVPASSVRPLMRQAAPGLHGAQLLVHAVGSLAPDEGDG